MAKQPTYRGVRLIFPGGTFTERLTLGTARTVQTETGVNLMRPELPAAGRSDDPLAIAVQQDALLAAEIAFAMCGGKDKIGIGLTEFLDKVTLDDCERIGAEIFAEIELFFGESNRPGMKQFILAASKISEMQADLVSQVMQALNGSELSSSPPSPESPGKGSPSESSGEPQESNSKSSGEEPPASA